MSKREDSAVIQDMKEAADRIISYTLSMEYEDFLQDYKTGRTLEKMGVAHLSKKELLEYIHIPQTFTNEIFCKSKR